MSLARFRSIDLTQGWQCRALDPALGLRALLEAGGAEGWHAASVPGTVQQDLLALGHIPDPHVACQEQQVQWVGERDWVYRLHFEAGDLTAARAVDLLFEGLDTFAEVWLNGQRLAQSDNMFVPLRVPVRAHLRPGRNELVLVFEAALRRGREREALFGQRQLWNGDSSRLHVRKAGYHYGWDWGPVLMTAGPWQPVRLQAWDVRLAEVDSRVWLSPSLDQARVDVQVRCEGLAEPGAAFGAEGLRLRARLLGPDGAEVARAEQACSPGVTSQQLALPVPQPALWWPRGHGAQPLYTLHTELCAADGAVLAAEQRRIGLRRLRLLQEPVAGESGRSWHFEVNGRALFMGGANWIPDDNLLNRIDAERYRQRVQQAADAHMLMLRVWGGGIYEAEAFYDACDELGVLVWQDFLFACGMYPAHAAYLASVQAEAEAAVRRLRHRASLALWCGNNEDYAVAESIGQYGAGKDMARFDARAIYEDLLPRVCAALDPERPYWPGSPYSPSATSTLGSADATVGDRHSWEVWHGAMLPYQDYHKVQARFVSEFGMQSHPSLPLLERVIPPEERYPNSRTMTWHNKAGSGAPDGHRRLAVYLADNLRPAASLAEEVYGTQFVQAEAMRYAYQDFRARWQRPGARAVGGALVWQLNDCWPVTSWAVIDSDGTVKPAWHSMRRALAPLALRVRLQPDRVQLTLMSDRPVPVAGELQLSLVDHGGQPLLQHSESLTAAPDGSTDWPLVLPAELRGRPLIAQARFVPAARHGLAPARDIAWPEPFRFHPLPDAGLRLERETSPSQGPGLWLSVQRPAKGVWLQAQGLQFGDNFIDLLPGEPLRVPVQGALASPIRVWALDQAERWW